MSKQHIDYQKVKEIEVALEQAYRRHVGSAAASGKTYQIKEWLSDALILNTRTINSERIADRTVMIDLMHRLVTSSEFEVTDLPNHEEFLTQLGVVGSSTWEDRDYGGSGGGMAV